MIETLEWLGCITGLCGASLLAMNNRFSGWGFASFFGIEHRMGIFWGADPRDRHGGDADRFYRNELNWRLEVVGGGQRLHHLD